MDMIIYNDLETKLPIKKHKFTQIHIMGKCKWFTFIFT